MGAENGVAVSDHARLRLAGLNIAVPGKRSMIAAAFGLAYLMLVRVLSRLALLARSDAAKDAAAEAG